jgi:hypothetical protein
MLIYSDNEAEKIVDGTIEWHSLYFWNQLKFTYQHWLSCTKELSLFVPRILATANINFLIILGHFASFAHLFDTGTDFH